MNGLTRIYTEDVNRDGITALLDAAYEGYTLIPALGRFNGVSEHSLIIELFGTPNVIDTARSIGKLNRQQIVSVMHLDGTIEHVQTGAVHTVNGLGIDPSDVESEEFAGGYQWTT